jgi:hypothetical protein
MKRRATPTPTPTQLTSAASLACKIRFVHQVFESARQFLMAANHLHIKHEKFVILDVVYFFWWLQGFITLWMSLGRN